MPTVYDFSLLTAEGGAVSLADYRGRVLLIVNVATRCGFTPQTDALESLYQEFSGQGFVVLGVPSDEFGGQTPEDDLEVVRYFQETYGVTFPVFAKAKVNGPEALPLFQFLKQESGGLLGKEIKWNFTKFLVGKDGQVIGRYAPVTKPEKLKKAVEEALLEVTP